MSLLDDAIWDAGDCADYFKVSRKHFLRALRFEEGFPAQLPWSVGRRPKWGAQAVKDWAIYAKSTPAPVEA